MIGKLYAVRNSSGQWFRAKGFGGYGDSWVDELEKARIYGKIATARACVSYWAGACPEYPAPELVELRVTEAVVLDEAARVAKAKKSKAEREAEIARREAKWRLVSAKKEMERAKQELKRARAQAGRGT